MTVIKSIGTLFIIGAIGFLYINQESLLSMIQEKKTINVAKIKKQKSYKIDVNIKDKNEYFVDSRLQNMYADLAKQLISQDKDIRKRLLFIQDLSSEDILKHMSELEPQYEIERKKLEKYCKNGSLNCFIEVALTGKSVEGSDVKMNILYTLDSQSMDFFNEVHYVNKEDDKWYASTLVSINEKRHYPKIGKFQDRKQEAVMHDNKSKKIDVTHVLEGRSNQWNIRF